MFVSQSQTAKELKSRGFDLSLSLFRFWSLKEGPVNEMCACPASTATWLQSPEAILKKKKGKEKAWYGGMPM